MKAALLKSAGVVVLDEVSIPMISQDEVLVEVKYCGICGSDLHAVQHGNLFEPGTYMGHEFSGILAEVGSAVKGWKAGDRVVVNPMYWCGECNGCLRGCQSQCDHLFWMGCAPGRAHAGAFARFVRVPNPESRLTALPDAVSFEEGALVEPLAVALHAIRISSFRMRDYAMVLGAGPIGLGVIAQLKNGSAGLVVALETNDRRAGLADKLGADYVLNPKTHCSLKEEVLDLTGGAGMDVVYDCSGSAEAFRNASGFLRKGGETVLLGQITKEVPILPTDYTLNEFRLQGSLAYHKNEFPMVVEFLKRRVSAVSQMITSVINLSDIVEKGFGRLSEAGNEEVKILVAPDDYTKVS